MLYFRVNVPQGESGRKPMRKPWIAPKEHPPRDRVGPFGTKPSNAKRRTLRTHRTGK